MDGLVSNWIEEEKVRGAIGATGMARNGLATVLELVS